MIIIFSDFSGILTQLLSASCFLQPELSGICTDMYLCLVLTPSGSVLLEAQRIRAKELRAPYGIVLCLLQPT